MRQFYTLREDPNHALPTLPPLSTIRELPSESLKLAFHAIVSSSHVFRPHQLAAHPQPLHHRSRRTPRRPHSAPRSHRLQSHPMRLPLRFRRHPFRLSKSRRANLRPPTQSHSPCSPRSRPLPSPPPPTPPHPPTPIPPHHPH